MSKSWLQTKIMTAARATVLILLCVGVILCYAFSQNQQMGFYLPAINSDTQKGYTDSLRVESKDEKVTTRIYNVKFKAYATEQLATKSATSSSSFFPSSASSSFTVSGSTSFSVSSSKSSLSSHTVLSGSVYRSDGLSSWHAKDAMPVSLPSNDSNIREALMAFNIVRSDKTGNKSSVRVFEMSLNDTQFANYFDLQQARIKRIKDACTNEELSKNSIYRTTSTVFYKSQIYNFTFCKVPKSGSTFWTKVFGVLKNGLNYANYVFMKSRSSVHGTMGQYVTTLNAIIRDQSRTILVSRCPYSRLFSAYIDKCFLQLIVGINYSVRNMSMDDLDKSACQTNVTFQEFLDWVIQQGKDGKTLNRHWAPIVSLCYPCRVNPYLLVKQETFAKDVENALRQLGVEKAKYDYIINALHDHRAELSLPGIISTLFKHSGVPVIKRCLGFSNVARRIWISLQIQGFIDESIEFPEEKFTQNQISNSTYFTEIVLQTINSHPMNTSQSKSQRQMFLYNAYKSINTKTIKGIQEMFHQDFEIFGYSKLPPTEI